MTLRLALPESQRRLEAVTVRRAGEILGCGDTTVRALLRAGELEGHRVGKSGTPNGVRIELQSVLDYKARHATGGEALPVERRRRRHESTPSYREALARAKALGLRV
jgi:excisionase family DNA binding protein